MRVGVTYGDPMKLAPYLAAIERAGLEPVPISPAEPRGLDGLAGLLVTGGGDIDPERYGQPRVTETAAVNKERDRLEDALIRAALKDDLPILAICRGLQMLNVVRGGTLKQHVEGHRLTKTELHDVRIEPDSRLAAIVNDERHRVNSRHHQAADSIGEGLIVTATAEDGVIEGLELPEARFVVAVQWHPEDRIDEDVRELRLFRAFAKAISRR